MSTPKRIQRQRTKGWRMSEGAVYVGRPTIFGNPFRAYKCDCCGYWDVRDDNDVTYLVDHQYVSDPDVRADSTTWTTRAQAAREAVRLYNDELTYWVGGRLKWDPVFREAVESLRGKDLACWCPESQPCHADVLLEIANSQSGVGNESERQGGDGMSMYEFDVRVVDIDREGYYYPRWDRATPMTITAPTRQDAINQASALMGECHRGRYWGVKVDRIRTAAATTEGATTDA